MSPLQRHAIVGDIGGTHARFAIADIDELKIDHFVSFESASFYSLEEALQAYLRSLPNRPELISLAIAGPTIDGGIEMTNLPWSTTSKDIQVITSAEHVCLINDFEALALALPHLAPHDLEQIGGNVPALHGTKAVLGAGTGLGVAALAWTGKGWWAFSGEGGHIGFSAQSAAEFEIIRKLSRDAGYVSVEHLLSAPGLVRVHRILQERSPPALTASEIVRMATVDGDLIALQAVRLFSTWLGRLAGDIALLFGALGGVYVGGGIAPRIFPFLSDGNFRAAFEAKGQLSSYMAKVPLFVIKSQDAGLKGAALALANMLEPN